MRGDLSVTKLRNIPGRWLEVCSSFSRRESKVDKIVTQPPAMKVHSLNGGIVAIYSSFCHLCPSFGDGSVGEG